MKVRRSSVDLTVVDSLPVLEASRTHLLDCLAQDRSDAHVVAAIEGDAALAIACVRFAQAPSVAAAVLSIPRPTLSAVAETLPATDVLASGDGWVRLTASFRRHARAVRVVAERLAAELPSADVDQLTTAALLHDVGKLPLYGAAERAEPSPLMEPEARLRAEQHAFGADHAELGGQLALAWQLPESLVECVQHHHEATEGAAGAVRIADMLAHYAADRPIDLQALIALAAGLGIDRAGLGALMYDFAHPLPEPREIARAAPLSARELEILRMLADGLLAKQVAHELGLADSTIRNHLHRIYRRIGAADRAQAVLIATAAGWL
jgi:putative nucleotidyltransferase with HDIG domain